MSKREVKTDLWVAGQLDKCGIQYTPQGSDVKEIGEALSSASKRGTGKTGFPEYVAVVNDFVIVIEDKADLGQHIKLTDSGILDTSTKAVTDFAVNGAYFYAKHIAQKSSFRKVFAIGVSGDSRHHKITPLYVDDRESYRHLPDVESFAMFTEQNIQEYYVRNVLEEKTDVEKTTEEILKDAAELHEYLRTYGSLKDQDKPLVVSGILLALDDQFFSVDNLKGDGITTDGQLICEAIQRRLKSSNVGPDAKRDKLMSEFAIIRTSARLNEKDEKLGKTPLKFYTEFLKERVFDSIKYKSSAEDFIGRFYGEFMSYSGGDGQSLGIILTPAHICELFCDLLDVQPTDIVLDPCCGTAGFLVAAMHRMDYAAGDDQTVRKNIRKKQLHGFELQSNMFAIACTNMILREDGNSNIQCQDFLKQNPALVQQKGATIGMMNPPYSQGTKADPSQYELSFVEHLLDSLVKGAKAAVIVPQSSMTGKTKDEQHFKESIMMHHTLEGVITCNTDTFYGVGTNPVIAVFTAHEPHPTDKICKFIDFRNDGYEVRAHIGLLELVASDYFEAYEFKNKRNEVLNKNYLITKGIDDKIRFVTGTDCHDWEVYPKEDSSDNTTDFPYTFAKCLPSFRGLVMALTDKHRLKRIDSFFTADKTTLEYIEIENNGKTERIPLSMGINVIIGDNSIGKSMLLHALSGFEKTGEELSKPLRDGYKSYLKRKNLKIKKQLKKENVFAFDMQGEVRKKFEENRLVASEFSSYFPSSIDEWTDPIVG